MKHLILVLICLCVGQAWAANSIYSSGFQKGDFLLVKLSPDNKTLSYVVQEGQRPRYSLRMVDLATKKETSFPLPKGRPMVTEFTADSKWFVYATHTDRYNLEEVHFINVATQTLDHTINLDMGWALDSESFDLSKDGRYLVISLYKEIRVFEVATGNIVYDSGVQTEALSARFFNTSNKLSVINSRWDDTESRDRSDRHYVIDPNTGVMTNSCPSDDCFTSADRLEHYYDISSDDQYLIFLSRDLQTTGVRSFKIANAAVATVFSHTFSEADNLYNHLSYSYDPKLNSFGITFQDFVGTRGSVSYLVRRSPNFSSTIAMPDMTLQITSGGYSKFLPKSGKFVRFYDNDYQLCDITSGCQKKGHLDQTQANIEIGDFSSVLVIGQDKMYSQDTRLMDLETGAIQYQSHRDWIEWETPTLSLDEQFLILNSFQTVGNDRNFDKSHIEVIRL